MEGRMRWRHGRKETGGLKIGNLRITTAGRHLMSRFLACFLLTVLGCLGALGCFYTGFSFHFSMSQAAVAAVAAAFVFSGLFVSGKHRISLAAAVLLLFFWTAFLFRSTLQAGIIHLVNGVIRIYTENSGFDVLPVETVHLTEIQADRVCELTMAFGMAVLAFLMVFLLTAGKKKYFLCIILTVPFFGASLLVGIVPDYRWILILFLFWALAVCDGSSLKGISLVILPVSLALLLFVIGGIFPKENYERSGLMEDLRVGILNGADITAMFRGGGIGGTVSRVDLSGSGDLDFTGKTMLKVRTAKTRIDYLKGFVGSVYTGSSWEPLSEEQSKQLEEITGEQRVQNFPYWFITLFSCPDDYQLYSYDLTVRNVGENARCVYTPYGLMNLPGELDQIEFAGDTGLRSGNTLFGTQEYQVQAINLGENYEFMDLYVRASLRYLQEEMRDGADFEALGLSMYTLPYYNQWEVPEELFSIMTEEQRGFIRTVEDYRIFVNEVYTQVPEELESFLNDYREAHGLTLEAYYYPELLAEAITDQIQGENTYTLTPGLTPEDKDFVEYFLTENHQGYCRHFASATALLLRSAGVPARYAEGYAVSPDEEKDDDGWINLQDSSAHAWVEIYVSGIGWMPIETTGSVRADLPLEENDGKEESAAAESTEAVETEPDKEEESESGTADDHTGSTGDKEKEDESPLRPKNRTIVIIWLAVLFILAAAGFILNRKIRIKNRRKRFLRKNRNLALLAAYKYAEEVKRLLPESEEKEVMEMEALALKARFSQHPVSEEELQKMFSYADQYKKEAEKSLTGRRRFYGKYVRGLF